MEQFHLFHETAERALGRKLSAREADRYWVGRTLDAVVADPVAWLGIMLRKLHLYWNGRELHNVYDYEFTRHVSLILGPPCVDFVYVAPFALAGVLLLLARPGVGRFLGLYAATICAAIVIVYVTDRYRLPVVAPLLVIATAFLREMVANAREARRRALAVWLAVWLGACLIAIPVPVNKRYEEKFHHLGEAYRQLGQYGFAEWALLNSLRRDPTFQRSHHELARVYEETGRFGRALAHYTEAARLADRRGNAALGAREREAAARVNAAREAGRSRAKPARTR
jgi:tetratricopeptide (TPR) repeat protein